MDTSAREKSNDTSAANGCEPTRTLPGGEPDLDAQAADRYAMAFRPSWAPLEEEDLREDVPSGARRHAHRIERSAAAAIDRDLNFAIAGRRQRAKNVFNAMLALSVFVGLGYWAIDDMFLRARGGATVPATAADDPQLALAAEQDFAADPPDSEHEAPGAPVAAHDGVADNAQLETALAAATAAPGQSSDSMQPGSPEKAPTPADTAAAREAAPSDHAPAAEAAQPAPTTIAAAAVNGAQATPPTSAAANGAEASATTNPSATAAAHLPIAATERAPAAPQATPPDTQHAQNKATSPARAPAADVQRAAAEAATTTPRLPTPPTATPTAAAAARTATDTPTAQHGADPAETAAANAAAANGIPEPPQVVQPNDASSASAEDTARPRVRSPLVIVRALPEHSKLWLDGQRMANPFDVRLARGSTHTIDARSQGYESMTQTVRVESDAKLTITLRRVAPAADTTAAPHADKPLATRTPPAGFVTQNPY